MRRAFAGNLLLAIAYWALGEIGLALSLPGLGISPVWLPVGLNLAALRIGGPALLPGAWLGATLIHLDIGHSLALAAAIGLGTAGSAWAGAVALRRWAPALVPDSVRGPLLQLALIYPIALLAALWGSGVLVASGRLPLEAMQETLFTWWLGDAVGMLVLTPTLLAAWDLVVRRPPLNHPLQVGAALVLVLILGWVSFVERMPLMAELTIQASIGIPLLAWLGLRAYPAVALAANVAFVQIMAAGAAIHLPVQHGLGPMLSLHVEILVTTLTVMILVAMAQGSRESRRRADDGERLRDKESAFSQAMLHALSDAGVGLMLVENQRITFATQGLLDMTGYSAEEVLALPSYQELIAPEDRARVAANQRRRLAGEAVPPRYDIGALRKDGGRFEAEIAVAKVKGDQGFAFLTAVIDVSARKAAEQELRNSEAQLRTLAEANFEGIVIHDQGKVVLANRRIADLVGLDPAQVIGMNLLDVIPTRLAREVIGYMNSGEAVGTYESVVRHADGGEIPVEITARPAVFQGRPVRIAAVRDIRAWKQARAELIASRDEAVRARQAEAAFFANMSHELRTPLHAVIGFAELGLEQCGQGQPELARYFERIRTSGERQLGLVNDLLGLARFEAGKMDMSPASLDLGDLARAIAEELAPLWSARRIRLVVDADQPGPTAECDRELMAQVLRNLLSNAIKFSPDGHAVTLAVALENDETVRITVSDEGVGIPADELETIFEKFTQSSRTRSGAGGTGLGLAICREVMAAHGGSIRAANKPGGGARFTCLLPRRFALAPHEDTA